MAEGRSYWNMAAETKLNTPEMKEIQFQKIRKKMEYLYNGTSFWRSWWDKAGVKPEQVKTWDDYYKRVPVYTKDDYRVYAEECDGDMSRIVDGLLGADSRRLKCLAATSGTTGAPTPYPLTPEDMEVWSEFLKRAFWRSGIFPGDRILHGMGLSMFLGGTPISMAIADYGACVIPVGAEGGTDQVLKWAELMKPDAMIVTPSFADYIIEKAPSVTGNGVDALGIKNIICGGEPGAGIPEVRQKIENAYNANLFDLGAGLGCSCDYPEYQGMHWLVDDLAMLELVNQETHEPIPLEDGATGLGVFTMLEGTILLGVRQTIGDILTVTTSDCPCGKTGLRYKVGGRTDDMMKVKGVMVYPPSIEGVINGFLPDVTGEFRIVLNEPLPRVVPPLQIKVEYAQGMEEGQLPALAEKIVEEMHKRVKIKPEIVWIPSNTLERFEKKKKVFEKSYEA